MYEADIAKRYAEAVYGVAKEKDKVKEIYDMLNSLMELYINDSEFRNFMLHPLIENSEKKDFLGKIFTDADDITMNIIDYLVDKDRIEIIRYIVSEYLKLYYLENNEVEVTGIFSKELSEEQFDLLKSKLEKKVGKKIILKIEVNKDIIGGGIVKMGDQIIDGSIKRQIENIKNTF
ncbi:F-type ATPase subunit delta [Sebaldella termitidis]|jgi:F-type H+-transporting ATPase subunit delta|uniref:ATP synthase subunit delta n=1 Tax=Sebaldella termitidis (strain ATCC 33386 / NCTC 11300) TaxID=526218 RepID=D1AKR9_SEBTE|nr:ATP synthase F1 subunit delta [Sebaldella termitidis]ACZ07085.1 ATP synthase F1, delta subunit [Sebaldella termitidis ATCC 33386]SUI22375.1 F-type ATPase subunit delta [Sebaldella termitidis]